MASSARVVGRRNCKVVLGVARVEFTVSASVDTTLTGHGVDRLNIRTEPSINRIIVPGTVRAPSLDMHGTSFRFLLVLFVVGGCAGTGSSPPDPSWDSDGGVGANDADIVEPAHLEEPTSLDKADDAGDLVDIAGHRAEEEIRGLLEVGVVAGFPDGRFRPDSAVTRAQFAAMVANAFLTERPESAPTCRRRGESVACSDLPSTHWAYRAIGKANAAGFLNGYPDGTMGPDRTITRTELAVALANGLRLQGGQSSDLGRFRDGDAIPAWARDAVANAAANGVFSNTSLHAGDSMFPTATATRATVASYLYYAQALYVRCDDELEECEVIDPRYKAAPLVIAGVSISYASIVAVVGAAWALGYIATYPEDFGAMLRAIRSLTYDQLWNSIHEARRRARTGTCSCAVRNLPANLQGRCPNFANGVGATRHDCNNAARASVPSECRRYVGHCDFRIQ